MKLLRSISLLTIVLACALAGSAYQKEPKPAENQSAETGPQPQLVIESLTHDFGELKSGTPLRWAFKVQNTGKADLVIESVNPSCGCTKGAFDKVVPPGKEGKIELAVEHTEGYQGETAKVASVVTNDPKNRNLTLQLRARFKVDSTPVGTLPAPLKPSSAFNVEPADKWITSVLSGGTAANSFYLVNTQANPVHAKAVVAGGTDFTAALEPIQDGRRYELKVTTNPALKPGHYTQTIRIVTDNAAAPETSIDLDLTVYPHVFVSPTSIIMPRLPSSSDLSAINWPMIFVRKLREGGLKITSFSSTLPFLKLDLVTETDGQVYKIRITLDATKIKPGEFKGKVRIETNDPEGSVLEVPIQGSFS